MPAVLPHPARFFSRGGCRLQRPRTPALFPPRAFARRHLRFDRGTQHHDLFQFLSNAGCTRLVQETNASLVCLTAETLFDRTYVHLAFSLTHIRHLPLVRNAPSRVPSTARAFASSTNRAKSEACAFTRVRFRARRSGEVRLRRTLRLFCVFCLNVLRG